MSLFSPANDSLHVVILLMPDSSLMSLASTLDTMRAANRISRRVLFSWRVITLDGEPAVLSCGQPIHPQGSMDEAMGDSDLQRDLLICIAAFRHEQHMDKRRLASFKLFARDFAYVGGVESGSWVLARAGLLDDKSATTHWEDLEDFRDRYPKIEVRPDRYVVDGRIFTTGGAVPTFDFILYLIRSRYGHTLALEVASAFIYDGKAQADSPQPLVSLGALEQHEPKLSAAMRMMESHLDTPLKTQEIAEALGFSVRSLENLFRRRLDISPHQYYKRLRLQAARRLVVDSQHSMQEIAVRSGFNSLAVFSREFSSFYGESPSRYRREARSR